MDKLVIKNIIFTSLILGLILGILAPIPYIGVFSLFGIMLLTSPVVMLYLIMDGKLEIANAKNSIIYGALSGFSANFTFAVAFSIIITIMATIFNYSTNLFLSSIIVNSPLWLLLICIIFIGTLTATTNAFSGFATYYIIEFIRDMYEKGSKNDRI